MYFTTNSITWAYFPSMCSVTSTFDTSSLFCFLLPYLAILHVTENITLPTEIRNYVLEHRVDPFPLKSKTIFFQIFTTVISLRLILLQSTFFLDSMMTHQKTVSWNLYKLKNIDQNTAILAFKHKTTESDKMVINF